MEEYRDLSTLTEEEFSTAQREGKLDELLHQCRVELKLKLIPESGSFELLKPHEFLPAFVRANLFDPTMGTRVVPRDRLSEYGAYQPFFIYANLPQNWGAGVVKNQYMSGEQWALSVVKGQLISSNSGEHNKITSVLDQLKDKSKGKMGYVIDN